MDGSGLARLYSFTHNCCKTIYFRDGQGRTTARWILKLSGSSSGHTEEPGHLAENVGWCRGHAQIGYKRNGKIRPEMIISGCGTTFFPRCY
jgi:hypothetical protein